MKKLRNTKDELKKALLLKKLCIQGAPHLQLRPNSAISF